MIREHRGGLRWLVALPSEAAPLITRFEMSLVHAAPFKVYRSGDERHWLVVSGIGKVAASGACAHLHALSGASKADAWLNVGIAGHEHAPLGTPFLAHKVTDAASDSTWYPGMTFASGIETCGVETVDEPVTEYAPATLYEMEASGYFAMAVKFSSLELSHAIKIVSDNTSDSIEGITRARVSSWVEGALPVVERVALALLALSESEHERLDAPNELDTLIGRWHFSVSEQHELRKLILRWRALVRHESLLESALMDSRDGKMFLKRLRSRLADEPAALGEL